MAQITHRLSTRGIPGAHNGVTPHRQISYLQEGAVTLFNMISAWAERRRTRHHLYQMPDYMLHDIGVSRAEVESEWAKPFWRA